MDEWDYDAIYPNGNRNEVILHIADRLGGEATSEQAERMLAALEALGFEWEYQHIKEAREIWADALAEALPNGKQ